MCSVSMKHRCELNISVFFDNSRTYGEYVTFLEYIILYNLQLRVRHYGGIYD